jgi:3-mercaptopyruvate sulfurtransferase SseA
MRILAAFLVSLLAPRTNVVFICGTNETAARNLRAFAEARFDAERSWYQGNAATHRLWPMKTGVFVWNDGVS